MIWTIESTIPTWTVNAERRMHHHERARRVRETRDAFCWLTRAAHVPRLDRVVFVAQPLASSRRGRQDVGACLPSVKAAVDGVVDAGVLVDDDDRHVVALTFLPVDTTATRPGLRLTIEEVS